MTPRARDTLALATITAASAAVGYARIRRRAPLANLPLGLRVKAALTMPPMSQRVTAAVAALAGQAPDFEGGAKS